MEQIDQQQKAAANLMSQFIESGFVVQDEDGSFIVPGIDEQRKFKPFSQNWKINEEIVSWFIIFI